MKGSRDRRWRRQGQSLDWGFERHFSAFDDNYARQIQFIGKQLSTGDLELCPESRLRWTRSVTGDYYFAREKPATVKKFAFDYLE